MTEFLGSDAVSALVVAKAPQPRWTKTRLAAGVGWVRAAELSAAALLDTLDVCRMAFGVDYCHLSMAGSLADAVDETRIRAALTGWKVRPQSGESLGERLALAHREVPGPVVQLGMDTPQVDSEDLHQVVTQLQEADAVLGPATDGGWWVLALRDPRRADCLRGVPMSQPTTGEQTLAALRAVGLSVALAPEKRDVDRVDDAEVVAGLAPDTEFARQFRMYLEMVGDPA